MQFDILNFLEYTLFLLIIDKKIIKKLNLHIQKSLIGRFTHF